MALSIYDFNHNDSTGEQKRQSASVTNFILHIMGYRLDVDMLLPEIIIPKPKINV